MVPGNFESEGEHFIGNFHSTKLQVQHLLIKCDFSSKGVNPLWSKKH